MGKYAKSFEQFIKENFENTDYSKVEEIIQANKDNTPGIEEYLIKLEALPATKKVYSTLLRKKLTLIKGLANSQGAYYADINEADSPVLLIDYDGDLVIEEILSSYSSNLYSDIVDTDFFWIAPEWLYNTREILIDQGII